MRLIKDTNIDFLGKRLFCFILSVIVISAGIVSLIIKGGPNYGIDFAGGTEVRMRFVSPPSIPELRQTLSSLNLGDVLIQSFGGAESTPEVLIRVERMQVPSEDAELGSEGGHISSRIVEALSNEDEKSKLSRGLIDLNSVGRETLQSLFISEQSAGLENADEPLTDVETPETVTDTDAAAVDDSASIPDEPDEEETDPSLTGETDLQITAEDLDLTEYPAEDPAAERNARELADTIIDYRDHSGGLVASFDELRGLPGIDDGLLDILGEKTFLGSFTVVGVDFVGPTVGHDLRGKAIKAIVWSLFGILIYISIRFKFHWGIGAVAALFHDVLVTVGIFSIFNREFNLTVVAALLTIVGYSLNDTIVVFDRIRDNVKLLRRLKFPDIVNSSINQTLSRTLLTSITTMLVVLSLYLLGGQVINNFAFALLVGVITGTYSSIFVASPILVAWQEMLDRRARRKIRADAAR